MPIRFCLMNTNNYYLQWYKQFSINKKLISIAHYMITYKNKLFPTTIAKIQTSNKRHRSGCPGTSLVSPGRPCLPGPSRPAGHVPIATNEFFLMTVWHVIVLAAGYAYVQR